MNIVELGRDRLPDVSELMFTVHDLMKDKSYYVPETTEVLCNFYDEGRLIALGCINDEGTLYACITFLVPEEHECYSNYLDEPLDVSKCIHADGVAVLPKYRGKHLQRYLLEAGESLIRKKFPERVHIVSTVHPKNTPSYKNLLATGYTVAKHFDIMPGLICTGLNRNIMYKKLS